MYRPTAIEIFLFWNKSPSKLDLSRSDSPGKNSKQKDIKFDYIMNEISNFEVKVTKQPAGVNQSSKVKSLNEKKLFK